MKNNKFIFSLFSIFLASAILFSSCGKAADGSEATDTSTDPTAAATSVVTPDTPAQTSSVDVSGSSTTQASSSSSSSTSKPTSPAKPSSGSTKKDDKKDEPKPTQAPTTTAASTEAPVVTEPATNAPVPTTEAGKDLKDMSLAELQEVLFTTEDPNIAGKVLQFCGFEYDPKQDIYFTTINNYQRYGGFNSVYDLIAPRVGMVYSTARIYFKYNNKDWMIQLWKGQYGITAGAEIGLYNKPAKRDVSHYDVVSDDEMIMMHFDFYNNDQYVFSRGPEKHWWLTGFKLMNVGIGMLIDLDIDLEFPNTAMSSAFEKGLKNAQLTQLIDPIEYERDGNKFNIKW